MSIRSLSLIAAVVPLLAAPQVAHATFCNDPTDPTAASLFSTAWSNATNPTLAMTSTIQFADVDGDGRDDLCGHDGTQVVCYTHWNAPECTGTICTHTPPPCFGFGTERLEADFGSDFLTSASRYRTLRFPDVNGDGRADVCARKSDGLYCALSIDGTATTEASFGAVTNWSSMFSDANGWNQAKYYATIAFVRLDGNAAADVCARGSGGIVCGFAGAGGFTSPLLRTDDFRDVDGWGSSESYYGTVRFADIDDDGDADVCGRGSAGVYCARWNHVTRVFADATLWSSLWSDVSGGSVASSYRTLQLADVNGDGAFDVCGRKADGVHCGLSNASTAFATDAAVDAGSFSDANGWNTDLHYRSIRVVDADGDGRADVCGRGGAAIHCQLARAVGQTPTTLFHAVSTWVNNFGDNIGWGTDEKYWGTVQPANVVDTWAGVEFCGRGTDGIWCSHR